MFDYHLRNVVVLVYFFNIHFFISLTSAFRTLVKDKKMEIIDKFEVEEITFKSFNALNAPFLRQSLFVNLFNMCPKDTC
jgi:hypothetical protein